MSSIVSFFSFKKIRCPNIRHGVPSPQINNSVLKINAEKVALEYETKIDSLENQVKEANKEIA